MLMRGIRLHENFLDFSGGVFNSNLRPSSNSFSIQGLPKICLSLSLFSLSRYKRTYHVRIQTRSDLIYCCETQNVSTQAERTRSLHSHLDPCNSCMSFRHLLNRHGTHQSSSRGQEPTNQQLSPSELPGLFRQRIL